MWINVLFRHGAVTAEDFLGQAGSSATRPKAADLDGRFRESLDKAIALAEARLRDTGASNADAHYQLGAAYGFLASYTATIEGSVMGALGPSKRAYAEQARCSSSIRSRKDAGLIVGLYRYGVSVLPLWQRMHGQLRGIRRRPRRGIKLVEEAASHSERRADQRAIRAHRHLQPGKAVRGRVARDRAAAAAVPPQPAALARSGEHGASCGPGGRGQHLLGQGLTRLAGDRRPRAFGEMARWNYQHGLALAALGKLNDAANTEFPKRWPARARLGARTGPSRAGTN